MELSAEAQESLRIIKIVREQLPECETTDNVVAKLLRKLNLTEVAEIAVSLKEWEAGNDNS
jgi:DNA-directed RNA polymerase subunit H (RpoH/RPB5)